jgi:hypothetical protein
VLWTAGPSAGVLFEHCHCSGYLHQKPVEKMENDVRHTTAVVRDVEGVTLFFFAQAGSLGAVPAGGLAAGGSVPTLGTRGLPAVAKRVEWEVRLVFARLLCGFRCTGVVGGMDESKCTLCGSDAP